MEKPESRTHALMLAASLCDTVGWQIAARAILATGCAPDWLRTDAVSQRRMLGDLIDVLDHLTTTPWENTEDQPSV